MNYHILVSDPIHPEALDWLREQPEVELDVRPEIPPEELRDELGQYDALILRSRTRIGPAELAAADSLRVIGRAGTGLDNIDLPTAQARGITVLNTPGANASAVAELTLGLLLAIARDLPRALSTQQKSLGMELADKRLGIIGFGQVGARVAQLAKAFGMKILAYDLVDRRALAQELGVQLAQLTELLAGSDFVSLHLPLTDETRRLINDDTLGQMAPGASLLNTARAEIVDEVAVVRALDSKRLHRYAADIYSRQSPLLRHPAALLTPHIGASTPEAQRRAGLEIARRVLTALQAL